MKRLTSSLFPKVDLLTEDKNIFRVGLSDNDLITTLVSSEDILFTSNEESALNYNGVVVYTSFMTPDILKDKVASVYENNIIHLHNGKEFKIAPESERSWVRNPFAPDLFMEKKRDRVVIVRGKKLQDTIVDMLLEMDNAIVLSKDFVETPATPGKFGVVTKDPNKYKNHFRVLLLQDNVEYKGKVYAELYLKNDLYLWDKVTKKRSWLFPQEMFWNHPKVECGSLQDLKDSVHLYIRNGLNLVSKEEYDNLSESRKLRSVVIYKEDFKGSKAGVFVVI